ncbi:MAG: C4-type zinc ribbon domain-containing protein [Chloroflexota bacterium]
MLSTYERLAKQKGGVGVVELKNGKCMGCQVSVPEHRIKDIDRGNIVYCDNCGRILCAR